MKNKFIKNLTNKQPTKDITSDDLKYKMIPYGEDYRGRYWKGI